MPAMLLACYPRASVARDYIPTGGIMSIVLGVAAAVLSVEWLKAVKGESPADRFWLSAGTAFIWVLFLYATWRT